jgi:hypothetical protein
VNDAKYESHHGASLYRVYASQQKGRLIPPLTRRFPVARYTYGLAGAVTPQTIVAVPKHLTGNGCEFNTGLSGQFLLQEHLSLSSRQGLEPNALSVVTHLLWLISSFY